MQSHEKLKSLKEIGEWHRFGTVGHPNTHTQIITQIDLNEMIRTNWSSMTNEYRENECVR